MGGVVIEEQMISHSQYMDLVYSQYGTLYNMIFHAPEPSNDPSIPSMELLVDGIIDSMKTQSGSQSVGKES